MVQGEKGTASDAANLTDYFLPIVDQVKKMNTDRYVEDFVLERNQTRISKNHVPDAFLFCFVDHLAADIDPNDMESGLLKRCSQPSSPDPHI